jgi:hypothetical protein
MPKGFIEHLERHLGVIADGSAVVSEVDPSLRIARFPDQPGRGATTWTTVGLSKHALHQAKGPELRIELLGCAWSTFDESGLDALLMILAEDILQSHHAPAQGSVVGPNGPIVDGSELEGFVFLEPGYHPDDLQVFEHPTEEVFVIWAVPVTAAELEFIAANGWPVFRDKLIEIDPDLLDLHRESMF